MTILLRRLCWNIVILCTIWTGSAYAADGVETAGDLLMLVLPLAAGGMILSHRDGDGVLQFVTSAGLALGTTVALKYAVSEERPNNKDDHSFPSFHASAAFTSAEFIRKRYGWQYGLPAYGAAAFVAWSRVEADEHYTHDVIAGAALGIVSSYLFTEPYKGWQVKAEGDARYCGLRLTRMW